MDVSHGVELGSFGDWMVHVFNLLATVCSKEWTISDCFPGHECEAGVTYSLLRKVSFWRIVFPRPGFSFLRPTHITHDAHAITRHEEQGVS